MISIYTDKPIEVQVSDGCGHLLSTAYMPSVSVLKLESGSFISISPDPSANIKKYIKK